MIGISLQSHKFSKQLVQQIAKLGVQFCNNFSIVLFDYPERHNWVLKPNTSPSAYHSRCLRITQERLNAYNHMLRQAELKGVALLTWQVIRDKPQYRRNLTLLTRQFRDDQLFRTQVVQQVNINIGSKITSIEKQNRPLTTNERMSLNRYLLEEIAGLLYLQFDAGYALDIYPGPQMNIMHALYDGSFPEINKLGYDWRLQGYLEVAPMMANISLP